MNNDEFKDLCKELDMAHDYLEFESQIAQEAVQKAKDELVRLRAQMLLIQLLAMHTKPETHALHRILNSAHEALNGWE